MKIIWQPKENNRIKINSDGASLPTLTKGELSGVVRGSQGQFIAAFAHFIQQVSSAKHVELLAIREGLDLAQQMQMSQEDLRGLQGVQIILAPRTCNQVAHRLANIGFESTQKEAWFTQAPSCISDLLQHDCNQQI
ncbi:uncharacterized protein LOC112201988 [Rosa chinensis]|uniref:uncharacterized protein LOC112201988 n=1 Tax=Rosa chinensis TaxID=74649 RepID=UPI001AD940B2|nr:uncharacterized protein LOC112201988 [Rosa chinensis]